MSDIAGSASFDVARVHWGGTWRLPTKDEFQELIDNAHGPGPLKVHITAIKLLARTVGVFSYLLLVDVSIRGTIM